MHGLVYPKKGVCAWKWIESNGREFCSGVQKRSGQYQNVAIFCVSFMISVLHDLSVCCFWMGEACESVSIGPKSHLQLLHAHIFSRPCPPVPSHRHSHSIVYYFKNHKGKRLISTWFTGRYLAGLWNVGFGDTLQSQSGAFLCVTQNILLEIRNHTPKRNEFVQPNNRKNNRVQMVVNGGRGNTDFPLTKRLSFLRWSAPIG